MSMIEGFKEHFGAISDPRIDRTRKHNLLDMLLISICTIISGGEGYTDMQDFGRSREEWFRQYIELPNGIPSHDTFRRLFTILSPAALMECFVAWSQSLHELTGGEVIALDGKVIRHSFDRATGQPALRTISAWATENGLALGHLKVDADGNEITALPKLLEMIDIRGRTVTIDAIGCQRELVHQIADKGAEYVLRVKANQESLHENLIRYFDDLRAPEKPEQGYSMTDETDHGRREIRECWAVDGGAEEFGFGEEWQGLSSIAAIRRTREIGESRSTEVAYYISSLPADAGRIARAARGHWGIENSLHWVLDVTMNEDMSRVRKDHAPENLATLRRIAVNMLKKAPTTMKDRPSIRRKMKQAAWTNDYLSTVLVS
jgi:predicted transposase YbfD/YdcC